MKAKTSSQAHKFEDIPNVGVRVAQDLRILGMTVPADLKGQDPLDLYRRLNRKTGQIHDPCMLDTLMAAVDFMNGGKPKPWWKFTPIRKKMSKG